MPDDVTIKDKGYTTIDELGPDVSMQYAESLKQTDDSFVKLRNVAKSAEVTTTNIRPAEITTTLNTSEPKGWVGFNQPERFDSHNKRIFAKDGLIPSLQINDQTRAKLDNMAALSKKEENQKATLHNFCTTYDIYNKMNNEIYGRCKQYSKG